MRKLLRLLIFLLPFIASAEENSVKTIAGDIFTLKHETDSECKFLLANKTILTIDCEDSFLPVVVGDFRGKIGLFEQVLVFQENPMGNACNGGALHFIGLHENGSYQISKPLDFCGGKAPVIKQQDNLISIIFPGGAPNKGRGKIPTEIWSYRNGEISRVH